MKPSAWADLGAAIGVVPHLDGPCKGNATAFDADGSAEQIAFSVECCLQFCGCLPECRRWLDSLPASKRPVGVVAGELITWIKP